MRPLRIAIVGAGRAGGSLSRAWRAAGHRVSLLGRKGRGRAQALRSAELVVLAVPDRTVADVAREVGPLLSEGTVLAHCSGALTLEPLEAAGARLHPGSIHPLCAIPTPRTALKDAWAAIDGDAVAARLLARAARQARMRPMRIGGRDRALYHAAAVLASNGLVAIAAEAAELLGRCGVEREEALQALLPLMQSALRGLATQGLPGALTGPVSRGDVAVVESHVREIRRRGADSTGPLYRALGEVLVRLAAEKGGAGARELAAIRRRIRRV